MSDGNSKRKDSSQHDPSSPRILSRYFDKRFDRWVVKVLPGTQYVTREKSEMIVTTLGSCVSACIRDERTGYSGMNHFMLPGDKNCDWGGAGFSLRFGHFAMESLLNAFFSMGSRKSDLNVKLFGGGNIADFSRSIGDNNAKFAVEYLANESIEIASSDLGGKRARQIQFHPATGKVRRRFIAQSEAQKVSALSQEEQYHKSLSVKRADSGSVELFDQEEESNDG